MKENIHASKCVASITCSPYPAPFFNARLNRPLTRHLPPNKLSLEKNW